MLLAFLLAVAPPSEEADERLHFALAAGGGLAYAYLGAHAEVRWRTVSLFVGTTLFPDLATQWPLSEGAVVIAAGTRFISHGDSGLLLSIHGTWARYQHHLDTGYSGSGLDPAEHDTSTAPIGVAASAA